jgi:ABC-type branched-subunit amino acid transport system substrate-binding protein
MQKTTQKLILASCSLLLCFLALTGTLIAQGEALKHVVGALDNYYSLSVKYNISIDELKNANPGVTSPKPGDVLIIPQVAEHKEEPGEADCKKLMKNRHEVYHVALMIPLHLEQLMDTSWSDEQEPSRIAELLPFRFIQYYHGFMMAADSLRQEGLNVEIYVYDVDQALSKALAILDKPEMKKMDLIFGPFFKSTFTVVAEFAGENRIPIINPLSSRQDILDNNPYVFKLVPSVESQPDQVARLINRDFSDHRVILYVSNKYQNNDLIERYRTAIEQADPSGKQTVTVVDYASDSLRGFRNYASLAQPNLVIVFSETEVLPAALLGKLNALKQDYQMSVIGLPEWDKFGNIESAYLMTLNAHVLMSSYADTQSEDVKGFINAYRTLYFDEPLSYAFAGFDAGFFFLGALLTYGHDFRQCIEDIDIPLIQNQFHFTHKNGNGYDNINWNVLQYYDYSLLKKSF